MHLFENDNENFKNFEINDKKRLRKIVYSCTLLSAILIQDNCLEHWLQVAGLSYFNVFIITS